MQDDVSLAPADPEAAGRERPNEHTSTSDHFSISAKQTRDQECMDGGKDEQITHPKTAVNNGDNFQFKGAASRLKSSGDEQQQQQQHGTRETCSICLEAITERAVAVPCNHLTFDFICLVSWLQERSHCPLCNAAITEVQYDFRGPEDFKRYRISTPEPKKGNESTFERSRRRRGQDFISRRSQRWFPQSEQAGSSGDDPALERRRRVYRDRMFSLHVGANRISQYRDFTPQDFAASRELQSRTRMFLRRELRVFTFLDTASAPRGGNREFLLEYVVAVLKSNEPKGADGHAEDLLADYLGRENVRLLLHELEAWLRSSFTTLSDWDQQVQYAGEVGNGTEVKRGVV
ncbi:uncharacterized protein LTR77_003124 [Saxophila tyrrhenica]|uniref:RING-type E3 ubiquitin transferase n=1 Tax=Saxophila tyrrhenica TaxID=1690608 RepID=A0AAV9PK19_9PEZI|nr:hypothetical protein LTR77_003124 [Saxophila tyrrhenica]